MTADRSHRPHLAVVGAGPAGLAAALAAARAGLRVTVLDAAPAPGGQYYRQPAAGLGARRPQALHHRWREWQRLRQDAGARHLTEHHVWSVERLPQGFAVHALLGPEQERGTTVHADGLLLATGGYETVLPFPGWTLPGVLTAGGAQAMLKGSLVLPGRTVVVAGTGPLLLPVATGLAAAGARIAALVESTRPRDLLPHATTLARRPPALAEAAGYAARLARHRVPVLSGHSVLRAHGTDRVESVTVAALSADGSPRAGTERRIPCDALAVSHGMRPHTDLADALGCALDGLAVAVDAEQRTGVPGVWAAGEATGIGGAPLAVAEGELAGLSAAARLRGLEPVLPRRALATRTDLRRFAAALAAGYRPPQERTRRWAEHLDGDTIACRCEEVTARQVRAAAGELGCPDLRGVKLLTRAGMGWCQGRVCGPAVAALAGCAEHPVHRPFARPVPLGVLADLPSAPE